METKNTTLMLLVFGILIMGIFVDASIVPSNGVSTYKAKSSVWTFPNTRILGASKPIGFTVQVRNTGKIALQNCFAKLVVLDQNNNVVFSDKMSCDGLMSGHSKTKKLKWSVSSGASEGTYTYYSWVEVNGQQLGSQSKIKKLKLKKWENTCLAQGLNTLKGCGIPYGICLMNKGKEQCKELGRTCWKTALNQYTSCLIWNGVNPSTVQSLPSFN